MGLRDEIADARQAFRNARSVAVLTGAGVSAESGIPTFRGAGGLWRNFRAEDLATPEAFARDPRLVWEWYDWRRSIIAQAQPNPGHLALVEMENRKEQFTLITQNVDGLHQRAGSRNVLPVHGDIWTLQCTRCGEAKRDITAPLPELPPMCGCGARFRPGVVWFGEGLPQDVWRAASAAASHAGLFIVAGTSAAVYPAASLVPLAKRSGALIVEVNPDETALSNSANLTLRGPSGEVLPLLAA